MYPETRTLYWHETGPRLAYDPDGFLHVEDLNPQIETRWHMSRLDMLRLAWQCLRVAVTGR